MYFRNPLSPVLTTALLCGLSLATPASAADGKGYSAAACSGANAANFRHVGIGCMRNTSASTARGYCPVVRETLGPAMQIQDWGITVDRRGATSVWDINLLSWNKLATTGFFTKVTVPGGSGRKRIDGTGITGSFDEGLVTIWSNVPARAEICSYQVTEK